MTKKDYQAVARAIHDNREGINYGSAAEDAAAGDALQRMAGDLASIFQRDNPRFDRARFVEACETGRCKGMPPR